LPVITVVLTWTFSPAETRSRITAVVAAKCPGMARTPSWVPALAPSRLTDTALTPDAAMRLIIPASSSGVTDGDRHTGTPSDVAYRIRSNKSGRSRQSPPVSTRIG